MRIPVDITLIGLDEIHPAENLLIGEKSQRVKHGIEWYGVWTNEVLLGTNMLCSDGSRLVIGAGECFVLPQTTDNDDDDIGVCKMTTMTMEVTTNLPQNLRPYRVPFAKQASVIVNYLLDNGIITKSKSAYASPIVLDRDRRHRRCPAYSTTVPVCLHVRQNQEMVFTLA